MPVDVVAYCPSQSRVEPAAVNEPKRTVLERLKKEIVTRQRQSEQPVLLSFPQQELRNSAWIQRPAGSKQYRVLLTLGLKNNRPLAAMGVVQARGAKPRLCHRISPVFKSRAYRPLVLTA